MLGTLKREEPEDPNAAPTFAVCAAQFIELRRSVWTSKHQARKWTVSLKKHAFPHIGPKPVDQITEADVMAVLEPIWTTMPTTGFMLRRWIGTILDWAAAQGYRDKSNPAGPHIRKALPRPERQVKHYTYLPHAEIPAVLERMELSSARPPTRLSFRFLVLTAVRPGDVRFAEWSEVDWGSRVWTVPAARAATRLEHHVPLSDQARHLLEDAWDLSGPEGLIFPGNPPGGDAISNGTLHLAFQRLDIPAVPYGFRSSFRDWCVERSGAPQAVCEAAIALSSGGPIGRACAHSDLFEQRRELMQEWADFCTGRDV